MQHFFQNKFAQKLAEKWARLMAFLRGSLMRRIASLALAGMMAVPVTFALGACTIIGNPDGSITIGPSGSGQSGQDQPQGDGGQDGQDDGQQDDGEIDLSQFSEILQNVLTSNYYKELCEIKKDSITLGEEYLQIPSGFLKQEGYDLNLYYYYTESWLEVDSDVYFLGDDHTNLYIACRIESEHPQGNYYTCYVLQYELTEQEYSDLELLHKGRYVQAPFFIQELTYEKQPVNVSKASINKDTYNDMIKLVNMLHNVFRDKRFELDFMGYQPTTENFSFTFAVRSAPSLPGGNSNYRPMIDDGAELRYLTTDVSKSIIGPQLYGDNVFYGDFGLLAGNPHREEYEVSQPITYFESDGCRVNNQKPWLYQP